MDELECMTHVIPIFTLFIYTSHLHVFLLRFAATLKVIVVGSERVGKTSFVQRLVKGTCPKEYNRTLGAVFSEKTVAINEHDEQCTLIIWDISGSAEFDEMTTKYY